MEEKPQKRFSLPPENEEYLKAQATSLVDFDLKNFGKLSEETEEFAKSVLSDAEYSSLLMRLQREYGIGVIPQKGENLFENSIFHRGENPRRTTFGKPKN